MRKLLLSATIMLPLGVMGVTLPAQANSNDGLIPLSQCLDAAHKVRPGSFTKVEFLSVTPKGVPTYEIELLDAAGESWEMMCSARSGDIYEIETEVEHASDPAFAKQAKITAQQAIDIAVKRFGGTPAELEYEIEFDGSPSYEIDLDEAGGGDLQYKVEVDAITGDIIELSVEEWQIGDEKNEDLNKNNKSRNM